MFIHCVWLTYMLLYTNKEMKLYVKTRKLVMQDMPLSTPSDHDWSFHQLLKASLMSSVMILHWLSTIMVLQHFIDCITAIFRSEVAPVHIILDMHILPGCLNDIHLYFTLSVFGSKLHIETWNLISVSKYIILDNKLNICLNHSGSTWKSGL